MTDEGTPQTRPERLVVIGSSAGGVDALGVLVATLSPAFPAPIVLAQHLDPRRQSNLNDILGRRTTLPVVLVGTGSPVTLESGTIYVVPANRHVEITDGQVVLREDHEGPSQPSIDRLLLSAAASFGEDLIAVILTGWGSDGAVGAVEVSRAGGIVVIQNPETALHPAMPLALPPTAVDYSVDLEQISPLLLELVNRTGRGALAPLEFAQDPLRDILALVGQQANIDFRQYKPTTILRRIGRRMAATRTDTLLAYQQYVEAHPEEAGQLVMAFLIKVTEFFRDAGAFEYLRAHVLPAIIAHGQSHGKAIRIWSAGCATGEEAYSLALLLADLLGTELSKWTIRIFATDLDNQAIAFARRGLYPANLLSDLPEGYRDRFFEPVEQGYRVIKALRHLVVFGRQDLSRGTPFPRIDLVLCRNVLIYFKPELQEKVTEMFAFALSETNGYLFLGQAEAVRPSKATYELLNKRWKIYRCIHAPLGYQSNATGAAQGGLLGRGARGASDAGAGVPAPALARGDGSDYGPGPRFNEGLLRFLPVGVVAVDRNYRVLASNVGARRLLGVRDLNPDQDFLHSARGLPYNPVRQAIDRAFRERATAVLPDLPLDAFSGGAGRYVSLTIVPVQNASETPDTVIISLTDVTEQILTRQRLEAVQADQQQLVDQLSAANLRLADLNKELQDANEELQASNEEMMLTQEELQATNEEFEASNEELQATNEELETNNEELQASNEELETTNEELSARTTDLQETMQKLARERARLTEIVELSPFYVIVLRGPLLRVEAYNPHYARMLQGQNITGQPLEDVLGPPDWGEIAALAHRAYTENRILSTVLSQRLPAATDGAAGSERQFGYTIVPSHEPSGAVDGVVIYAEDVTERTTRAAQEQREQLKLMVESASQVAIGLYDAPSRELLQASPRYLNVLARLHHVREDTVIGQPWDRLPLLPPGDETTVFETAVRSRQPSRLREVRLPVADGEPTPVFDFSLIPIGFREEPLANQADYVVVSAVEITDQVRAREELERVDRLKDEFLATASHELRTPLVPLRGYAHLLTRALNETPRTADWEERLRGYVGKFDGQIGHLARLVDDLVDVGRLETGKLALDRRPVDLCTVVQETVDAGAFLAPETPIEMEVPPGHQPVMVEGDAERLVQVGTNLLENAVRYAPASPRFVVCLTVQDGWAEIAVQDFGPGIPAEHLDTLFERFYQVTGREGRMRRGLGLGLFIARQIAEHHGGTLTAESTVGAGSTFRLRLPLMAGEAPPPAG